MSDLALDEMSVLSAIYCEKDEFELLESAEKGLVFRIQLEVERGEEKVPLSLLFQLPPEYPQWPPDISVSSEQLSRKQCQDVKSMLADKASTLTPEPMVHHLVTWLQQNFSDSEFGMTPAGLGGRRQPGHSADEDTCTALLLLDHMRSKTKYVKIIEKWTSELGLTGRLFIGKLILILLQGARSSIKEYLRLQRTVKVDVDSAGRRCKERMMRVLCETPLPQDLKQISAFEVKEYSSLEELKMEFELVYLSELYEEFVPLLL